MCEALAAAHEQGVIHRDLKPANIKLRPDGTVKVLDFGLAKVFVGDASEADRSRSPTVTLGGTREGVILGTAAYMSPEQARGLAVDKRTDIWAFGCVLHEMLTGRALFLGPTVTDTLAAILEREPAWDTLPGATPAGHSPSAPALSREGSDAAAARHRGRADGDRGRAPRWCSHGCGHRGRRSDRDHVSVWHGPWRPSRLSPRSSPSAR